METSGIWSEELRSHPPEEVLERYAMHRATDAELEQVEEHLLICGKCRDALDESERWVTLMKTALPAGPARPVEARWRRWWQSFAGTEDDQNRWYHQARVPVYVGALAVLLVAVSVTPALREKNSPVQEIRLEALRGNDLRVEVAADRPAQLQFMDLAAEQGVLKAAIVTASGSPVWEGPVHSSGARIPALRPGSYWVRIFNSSGEQIKEYGLNATR